MESSTGLSERTLAFIRNTCKKYPAVSEALIFGSRAKGEHRDGSDIDICLKTDGAFTHVDLLRIMRDFDESSLPYKTDILEYKKLTNEHLAWHIDQVGVAVYKRDAL